MEKSQVPRSPGLSNTEAPFTIEALILHLRIRHLCESASVPEGHSIHYAYSSLGPIGLCVFNLQLEVLLACWGLSRLSQQGLPGAL